MLRGGVSFQAALYFIRLQALHTHVRNQRIRRACFSHGECEPLPAYDKDSAYTELLYRTAKVLLVMPRTVNAEEVKSVSVPILFKRADEHRQDNNVIFPL
jgi:hypothetical protein